MAMYINALMIITVNAIIKQKHQIRDYSIT